MGYAEKANAPPSELAPIKETKQPSQPAAEPKKSAEEQAEIAEQTRLAEERKKIEKERAEAEKRDSTRFNSRAVSITVWTTADHLLTYLVYRSQALANQI